MPTSLKVFPEERYVEVIHRGPLTLAELEDARVRSAELLSEWGLSRLLVDGRDADISALTGIEAFEFSASHVSVLPSIATLRIAIVTRQEHVEEARFAETVARNRAVNVRVFQDREEACRWLASREA